ncbi:MAG: DUF4915 domain-containing protein [Kouleothrix sp.]|nr:DUF4915 domain-containing protein [Kouleothrix sp.]
MTTNPNPAPQDQELRRVYTTSLAELFAQLNLSLVVSTYQAGKVILVRHGGGAAANGNGHAGVLNTHFRAFPKPMGIALQGNRLALGSQKSIWELHNMPALARKLEPEGKHDACYLPRHVHVTGEIDIHALAETLLAEPAERR